MTIPVVECDRCHRRDLPITVESTIVKVKLPGIPAEATYSGDHCAECAAELNAALFAALEFLRREQHYVKRTRKRRDADDDATAPLASSSESAQEPLEDRTCPLPECGYVCRTRSALRQHLKDRHKTTLSDVGIAKIGGRRTRLIA